MYSQVFRVPLILLLDSVLIQLDTLKSDKSSKRRACLDPEDVRFEDCQLNVAVKSRYEQLIANIPFIGIGHIKWFRITVYCKY
jgi:hypothetical protein